MQLTKESEKLIKTILDNNFFNLSKKSNEKTEKIKKIIFDDIKTSYLFTNKLLLSTRLNPTIMKEKPNVMVHSKYVPNKIKKDITNFYKWNLIYTIKIQDKVLKIIFGLKTESFNKVFYDNKVKHIIALVKFYLLYVKNNTIKKITLHLYLTPYKKMLPRNSMEILSPEHCNSALTYPCSENVVIFIFRNEEWFKVLGHEIMHAFCLDFSMFELNMIQGKMSALFPIKSDFLISETYAEFWGNYINCGFISYNQFGIENNFSDYKLHFNILYSFEKYFGFIQCVKILNHMQLTYEQLLDTEINKNANILYKENTNVFCYYILKIIFYFFDKDFLLLCYKNNDNIIHFDMTKQNIVRILNFIKSNYNSNELINTVKKMEETVNNIKSNTFIMKNNRMTINELDL